MSEIVAVFLEIAVQAVYFVLCRFHPESLAMQGRTLGCCTASFARFGCQFRTLQAKRTCLINIHIERVPATLRWRATVRPRIVNIIISCSEGGAHSTTQYISMAEIESRIFSQNFGCCVETCVSWLVPTCRPSTYGGIETVLFENSSYRGFGEALYAGH